MDLLAVQVGCRSIGDKPNPSDEREPRMIPDDVLLVILLITRMIVLYSAKALLVYLASFRTTGRVHIPYHPGVAVYDSLGVVRLYRKIRGEVERGMVRNLRSDVTLTHAGLVASLKQTGKHCQLQFASGWGTLTSLPSFHAGITNRSIGGKKRLEVVLHLSAVSSIGATGWREPRSGTHGNSSVESTFGMV